MGLFSLFTSNILAQKTDSVKTEQPQKECSLKNGFKLPAIISIGNEAFKNYIEIMSLPSGKRQRAFSELSNEDKAIVFKVQLALQFVKRPNLTKEQNDLILETISKISADTYDKGNPDKVIKAEKDSQELQDKALSIFPPNEAYEIFATLNGEKDREINLLRKYEEAISLPTMGKRQKLFREMSPTERSNFWRTQMVYYLSTSKLNKEQQNFILKFISLATPKALDLPTIKDGARNEETNALDALEEEAFRLFTKEEVAAIFMSFGIHKIPGSSQNELLPGPNDCDCRWFCFPCEACHAGTGCTETTSGCGWSGDKPCTHGCRLLQNCP